MMGGEIYIAHLFIGNLTYCFYLSIGLIAYIVKLSPVSESQIGKLSNKKSIGET
jgi:hypothetical protein